MLARTIEALKAPVLVVLALFALHRAAAEPRTGDAIGGPDNQGTYASVDFPSDLWMANIGSKLDGAGMCVDTSVEMSGLWAGVPGIKGFRDYWAAKERGGNYPAGLVRQIRSYYQTKGLPEPEYVQYEGPDPRPLLRLCSQTGRIACITYGYSPRYGRGTIYHMTCCPHFGGGFGVCMDNNAIGGVRPPDRLYEWVSEDELVRRIKHADGSAWVFVWLQPGAPPPPWN